MFNLDLDTVWASATMSSFALVVVVISVLLAWSYGSPGCRRDGCVLEENHEGLHRDASGWSYDD